MFSFLIVTVVSMWTAEKLSYVSLYSISSFFFFSLRNLFVVVGVTQTKLKLYLFLSLQFMGKTQNVKREKQGKLFYLSHG